MAHKLPPVQCPANTYSFTDTIADHSVDARPPHISELRAQIAAELSRRGLTPTGSWTDSTITVNVTKIRKVHIDELRSEVEAVHNGRSDPGYCPEDTVTINWTDPTITANSTVVKASHMNEMRNAVNGLKSGCICETEQCQYCADCGHYYYQWQCWCYINSVGCCGDCGPQACSYYCNQGVWNCGSLNVGGANPYKSYAPAVSWDGWVPWNWGDGIPSGSINWTSYWTCKCNPFATS